MKVEKKMLFFPFLFYFIQKRIGDYHLGEQHVARNIEDKKQMKDRTKVRATCCGA